MLAPHLVQNPLAHVCLVRRPDGRLDLHRPGSFLFGSLAPVPAEAGRYFGGRLPSPMLHWEPRIENVVGVFESD